MQAPKIQICCLAKNSSSYHQTRHFFCTWRAHLRWNGSYRPLLSDEYKNLALCIKSWYDWGTVCMWSMLLWRVDHGGKWLSRITSVRRRPRSTLNSRVLWMLQHKKRLVVCFTKFTGSRRTYSTKSHRNTRLALLHRWYRHNDRYICTLFKKQHAFLMDFFARRASTSFTDVLHPFVKRWR